MTTPEIEKRLNAIERDLASLKAQGLRANSARPVDALERIHATFENDEAFREAMRLGRASPASSRAVRKSKGSRT